MSQPSEAQIERATKRLYTDRASDNWGSNALEIWNECERIARLVLGTPMEVDE
jgi:hypothetical protein